MRIEAWIGEDMEQELKELLETLIAEWMSHIGRKWSKDNPGQSEQQIKLLEDWEKMLKETCPGLVSDNQKFLNQLIVEHGDELEDYYMYGLIDGARAMKWLLDRL